MACHSVLSGGAKAEGEGVAVERQLGPVRRDWIVVESVERGFRAAAAPSRRAIVLMATRPGASPYRTKRSARARVKVDSSTVSEEAACCGGANHKRIGRARAGLRTPRRRWCVFRGEKSRGSAAWSGQPGARERTRRRIKASQWTKPSVGVFAAETLGSSSRSLGSTSGRETALGASSKGAHACCGKATPSCRRNLASAPRLRGLEPRAGLVQLAEREPGAWELGETAAKLTGGSANRLRACGAGAVHDGG